MEENKESLVDAAEMAKLNQITLDHLVRLDIRNMLDLLTSNGINGVQKKQIKESIERAIMFPFDLDLNLTKAGLAQEGRYSKLEQTTAAHLAKLIDNTTLLRANNFLKEEK